ncbi:class I adenylate-forming enzyme family protein [Pseudonocardia sp. N23]|uniref:AMP-binding protein n=1 Tax=Pseudonocardia sp. N23 TaxID=1987376 RepID=UPI000C022B17|nr:class I adenylate-forming enzyme family protein [Pseudonocardia sp. N23]GAY11500.1 long-chain-fatty-acid--CoA ligase [Pseudonocardia sp. N23]
MPDPGTPPASATLPALVADLAAATPDAPAVVAGGPGAATAWTYAELDDAARRAAAALAGLGAGPGEPVALLAGNSAEWLAATLGAMRTGARVDAVNTWVKAWDLRHLLATCDAPVLVMDAAVRSSDLLGALRELLPQLWDTDPGDWTSVEFPALREVVVLDRDPGTDVPRGARRWSGLTDVAPADVCAAQPGDTAFVLYTSGSTRHPKAVPLRQRDTVVNGFHIGERMGLTADDRVWLGSPLFWSFGAANALPATFSHGACLVVQDQFEPAATAAMLAEHRCTAAYLLPTLADALAGVAEQVRAVTTLRTGLSIGRPDELRRIVDDLDIPGICNIYGSTETYGNCCVTPHDAPLEMRLTAQGPALPGNELRVVDDAGTVLGVGEFGELQVHGRVMRGYLGDDAETADNNAKALTADGWYRTGDRLRIRDDGWVEFGARLTDMIKTNGINVAPAEVEGFLSGHPAVAEVAVVGAPHPGRGEVVVAFATLVPGSHTTGQELREHCRASIAGYKVPWEVVVVDALPRTGTGKLTRLTLAEDAAERVRRAV